MSKKVVNGSVDRRNFLKTTAIGGVGLALLGSNVIADPFADLSVAIGDDPAKATRAAVDAIGGIKRFVKPGQSVMIKPNISWDRVPAQAATTNPDVVAAVVAMCKEAGAKRVVVTDNSLNDARRCFKRSGIADAVKAAGGEAIFMNPRRFKVTDTGGKALGKWEVYSDALNFDCLINIPIAKHHSSAKVTLGMKNLYGLIGGPRNRLHQRMDQGIADLGAFFKPQLTIIDAYRILLRNGPSGGRPTDTKLTKTIIASADIVAADARAAQLFGHEGKDVGFIRLADQMGVGTMDLSSLNIKEFNV
jgi:uncharacterized protein (DUF362 family)